MYSISRARRTRALVAGVGLGLVATPLAFVATPAQAATPVEVTILATNDFHGRLLDTGEPAPPDPGEEAEVDISPEAGAATLSGAVKQIRSANPNTVFAAAGDLIGASTFESFIQDDNPTIDALNEAGLDVSAVGNHEFDKGYDDLAGRVQDRADWEYIGANIQVKAPETRGLEPSYIQTFNGGTPSEVKVGFVGAVTEDLPSLVSPAGIEDIEVTDIVAAVNTEADALAAQANLDLVVLLVHEGAPTTNCATMDDDPTSAFGEIVTGVNDNVDAIVSGHTHLAYNCSFPVAGWANRAVKERPVVSAGQYGTNLNQLVYTVDAETGDLQAKAQEILELESCGATCDTDDEAFTPNYPADPATKAIVDQATAVAEVEGAKPVGDISAPFDRAKLANGTTENRGGESTLGNLVAEIQQTATEAPNLGAAQIAFMNPGGLRADLRGTGTPGGPAAVTFKQAAVVQPFANTLVNMDLTGAQIKTVLEQQWQPAGSSRPFLKLGVSKGFEYTYDPGAAAGSRITAMYLNGRRIVAGQTYSVTVNSFLASGGDNFTELDNGAGKQDTGQTDLQAFVEYFDANASDAPLAVDYSQRSVGVSSVTSAGGKVSFKLSSLAMSAPNDVKDTQVAVSLGGRTLGTFPVVNTIGGEPFDENGTASVAVTLPANAGSSPVLTVTGAQTGTAVDVPVTGVPGGKLRSVLKVDRKPQKVVVDKTRAKIIAKVRAGNVTVPGLVKVFSGGETYRGRLKNGRVMVQLDPYKSIGSKRVRVKFTGSDAVKQSTKTIKIYVSRNN